MGHIRRVPRRMNRLNDGDERHRPKPFPIETVSLNSVRARQKVQQAACELTCHPATETCDVRFQKSSLHLP